MYVDTDRRAERFFADRDGVEKIIEGRKRYDGPCEISFHRADCNEGIGEPEGSFDLLVSLYAGFVSQACKKYLRPGGWLVANNSHADAGMASIAPGYEFVAAITGRVGRYRLSTEDLDGYFIPKKDIEVTEELLCATGRGVGYTKTAAAYVFRRCH